MTLHPDLVYQLVRAHELNRTSPPRPKKHGCARRPSPHGAAAVAPLASWLAARHVRSRHVRNNDNAPCPSQHRTSPSHYHQQTDEPDRAPPRQQTARYAARAQAWETPHRVVGFEGRLHAASTRTGVDEGATR